MLYVHDKPYLENYCDKSKEEVDKLVEQLSENFWAPRDDQEFYNQLYRRSNIKTSLDSAVDGQYPFEDQTLRWRNGISPVAENVRNLRYKQKPRFDTNEVYKVERVLKDLIDRGFSD